MSSSYSKSQISFKNRARFSSFAPPKNPQATETCTIPYKLRCKTAHTISRRKLMLLRVLKGRPSSGRSSPEKPPPDNSTKKGTILGSVSLIVGTSIGSGILALPQKTSPAGFIPTATSIVLCWVFLVVEALLLAELNTNLRKKMKKDEGEGGDLEVVSLRTMAQETLGDWGGNLATVTYLFLGYTSVVAYTSMSGGILSHLISLPSFTSGSLFTLLMALLMLIGGTNITDQVNQWLTFTMIGLIEYLFLDFLSHETKLQNSVQSEKDYFLLNNGECDPMNTAGLLVMIEVMSVSFGGGSGSVICNWEKVPQTIPVIIFSLVYHDIVPGTCAALRVWNEKNQLNMDKEPIFFLTLQLSALILAAILQE
ncbi:hypothetical protein Cni_G18360 [Canna indica]|uniref:Tyrosine-specific transport protein n=1 Tax=Canna indica TaxID=4628 RepID=A0AAQ3KKQ9_9LILI|nr:hypothetical protein Cni_G18360 [Canna indica]